MWLERGHGTWASAVQLLPEMQARQTLNKHSGEASRETRDHHKPSKPSDPIPERSSSRIAHIPSFVWEVGNLIAGRGKFTSKEGAPIRRDILGTVPTLHRDRRWSQGW